MDRDHTWDDPWREMMDYIGFGAADVALLHELAPEVEPHLPRIADNFYNTIRRFPGARTILKDEAQVQRLKQTLMRWIRTMLQGPYDEAYWSARERIGEVHVRVGLSERYVFSAMNLIRNDLCALVRQTSGDEDHHWAICLALHRITDLELAAMSAAFHEAHEQRRLRSLQDLIVQNLPITVLLLDAVGHVTSATRPSARLFGNIAEVGKPFDHFLPAELVEMADLRAGVARAMNTGREINIPRVMIGEGTEHRTFRITLVPLQHETARMLIHVEDLTDIVLGEARLQQAEALARIGSLAANVAHEIRNPLAAISATLQVIVGSEQNDRRKVILGKVQEQVHRLDRLVSDLLGYARPAEARLSSVRLADLAADAINLSGVSARLVTTEDVLALGDGQYVQQILVNLLQNARDAGGADAHIEVIVGPGPQLEVVDDGPGISAEIAHSLFEPFVTTKAKGTGLGLAISRKLAEAMGGRLELIDPSDDVDQPTGARFRLSLTRHRQASGRASRGDSAGHSG